MTRPPALLALEDGTIFRGRAFGATTATTGEVCFNTGMTGYQEILTDPSYHGQIVTMTSAQIGNTGANRFDDQSRRPWVAGFVVRDLSMRASSWRAEEELDDYLGRHGIPGMTDVDTRRLTRHIRDRGAMRGAMSMTHNADELVDRARSAPPMAGLDLASSVTTDTPYEWTADLVAQRASDGYIAGVETSPATARLLTQVDRGTRRHIAAFDYGIKHNILDLLVAAGFDVTVVPATTDARWILDRSFDGVFLSNGPGDPEPVSYAIDTVRTLVGQVPVFGICLGHQILGLALGARTFKLPFGHRGSNHPVRRLDHAGIEITCQNHGFAVDPGSLGSTPARLSHVNLNDDTVEGIEVPGVCYSVQYHPESGPGPHDSRYLFAKFHGLIDSFEPAAVPV